MKFFHAFFTLILFATIAHGQIRIGGSDLLKPNFAEALKSHADAADLELWIDLAGSYPALSQLKEGNIDLALVAIPDGREMPEESFEAINIGSKVLAIAVPAENPLNQITLHQLWAIFGDAEGVTRWGEVGLVGDWAQRSIVVRSVSRAEHTLAVDLFRNLVLTTGKMKNTIAEFRDFETVRRSFREEGAGIALLDRIPENQADLKILPVARKETDFAHNPTPDSVANENYPLRLPIYAVFPKSKAAELKPVLQILLSADLAAALEADGLMPRSRQHRERLQFEFERY